MRRPVKHETLQKGIWRIRVGVLLLSSSLMNVRITAIRSVQNEQYARKYEWEPLQGTENGRDNSKPEFVRANQINCIEFI
jgi:hypothetical protein